MKGAGLGDVGLGATPVEAAEPAGAGAAVVAPATGVAAGA